MRWRIHKTDRGFELETYGTFSVADLYDFGTVLLATAATGDIWQEQQSDESADPKDDKSSHRSGVVRFGEGRKPTGDEEDDDDPYEAHVVPTSSEYL